MHVHQKGTPPNHPACGPGPTLCAPTRRKRGAYPTHRDAPTSLTVTTTRRLGATTVSRISILPLRTYFISLRWLRMHDFSVISDLICADYVSVDGLFLFRIVKKMASYGKKGYACFGTRFGFGFFAHPRSHRIRTWPQHVP